MSKRTVYNAREADAAFAEAWDDAIADGTALLEDEARRRAFEGVEKPIHYMGERVDTVRQYSDTLLHVLLKARAPRIYRERMAVEVEPKEDIVKWILEGRKRAGIVVSDAAPLPPDAPPSMEKRIESARARVDGPAPIAADDPLLQ